MNIWVQVFVWPYIVISFGKIHRRGIVEPYGKYMCNLKETFSFPQWLYHFKFLPLKLRVNFRHSNWHMLGFNFHLLWMTNDIEYLFVCLLMCIFMPFVYLKIFVCFFLFIYNFEESFLYSRYTSPPFPFLCPHIYIFSLSQLVDFQFILNGIFMNRNINFYEVQYIISFLLKCCFLCSKKPFPIFRQWRYFPLFLLKCL